MSSILEIASVGISHLEIWKDVVRFEGFYEVSNFGNVKSFGWKRNCFGVAMRMHKIKMLKGSVSGNGYKALILTRYDGDSDTKERMYVHRMVLETFVGPCPEGMECRHLDGDMLNNRLDNLCWGTRKENAADRVIHGTDRTGKPSPTVRGEGSWTAKLTEDEVLEIRNICVEIDWVKEKIWERYGVSSSAIGCVVRGDTWKDSYKVWVQSRNVVHS